MSATDAGPVRAEDAASRIVLLGPQRFRPAVAEALAELGPAGEGPIAVITAGWQEREAEVEELRDHVGVETVNLSLYTRADNAFAADAELHDAMRRRQDRLQQLQEIYRLRLDHALPPAMELMRRREPPELIPVARRSAIRALRTLDAGHLKQVRAVHAAFEDHWQPSERPVIREHRRELAESLARCTALAIAGGHVAVLLNRTRMFDVLSLLDDKPIVAWSAGAMVLARRIVLFHDRPPQGRGNAEVFDAGLGLAGRVLPLPDAANRLLLDDPRRVALLARRFASSTAIALDAGSIVRLTKGSIHGNSEARRLTRTGRVLPMSRS